jgi:hypothetical protein
MVTLEPIAAEPAAWLGLVRVEERDDPVRAGHGRRRLPPSVMQPARDHCEDDGGHAGHRPGTMGSWTRAWRRTC